MPNQSSTAVTTRHRSASKEVGLSPEHYLRLIVHRWWLVLGTTLTISAAAIIYSHYLPNVYTSETVILVDPQKVPDSYVKSTVTGDVRNRLSTLSQQILSATRLQRIIETLNLYPEDRKRLAREDIITRMRADISVQVVSDFGASQDFQAFRITYSGKDARLVAQVTNELASLFIEENLKAREQQATGTTEFLGNQLQETRKDLEAQEAKLKQYKMLHLGEMPEQQSANNAHTCFNWFNPEDTARDSGEACSIRQMIARMVGDTGIDPRRIFVTTRCAPAAQQQTTPAA